MKMFHAFVCQKNESMIFKDRKIRLNIFFFIPLKSFDSVLKSTVNISASEQQNLPENDILKKVFMKILT